jgi:hypothetical protein
MLLLPPKAEGSGNGGFDSPLPLAVVEGKTKMEMVEGRGRLSRWRAPEGRRGVRRFATSLSDPQVFECLFMYVK